MRSLYDVSFLVSLFDRNHDAHRAVSAWFAANAEEGWASCPLTQNGCVRVLSQPRYPRPISPSAAAEQLRSATSAEFHQFIPDDISLLDETRVDVRKIQGHRQIADVYLLALAVAHDARLVTLDRHIPLDAVHGANESHLGVI